AAVGRWIADELPAGLRGVLPAATLGDVTDLAIAWLVEQGFPLVRDHILAPLEVGTTLRVALGDLPLRRVDVRTIGGRVPALVAECAMAVPVWDGLPRARELPARGRVEVRLSGGAVAELANVGMATGALPSRFDEDGDADPVGPFEARVGWVGGARPL